MFVSAGGAKSSRSRAPWRRCCPSACRSRRRSTRRRESRRATFAPRSRRSAGASSVVRRCRRRSRTIAISSRRSTSGSCAPAKRAAIIDSAFARLSDQLERDEQLRGKVLSASIYPVAAGERRLDRRHGAPLLRAAALRHAARGKRREAAAVDGHAARALVGAAPRAGPCCCSFRSSIAAFAAWATNTDEGRRVWSGDAARAARRAHAPPLRARRPLRAARRRAARRRRAAAHGARRHDRVDRRSDRARRRGAHSHARARRQLAPRGAWPRARSFRRCSRS